MAPVNPYAIPQGVPAKPAASPANLRKAPAEHAGFKPGLDAPRATPRLADLIAAPARSGEPSASEAAPVPSLPGVDAPARVSLSQLSAYAGLVMETANPAAPSARAQAPAQARNVSGERPLRPGSRLDLKV